VLELLWFLLKIKKEELIIPIEAASIAIIGNPQTNNLPISLVFWPGICVADRFEYD
jgi:hypothetical protein